MGELQFIARPVDLIFGPNSELRAVVDAYADAAAGSRFIKDLGSAWQDGATPVFSRMPRSWLWESYEVLGSSDVCNLLHKRE